MTRDIAKDIADRMVILIRINILRYQPVVQAMSIQAILHSMSSDLVNDLPQKMRNSSMKTKKSGIFNNSIIRTSHMVKTKKIASK